MKTIGIIAEFNPFHNGHLHLIDTCKKALNADFCIVVMSGDFVQRGTPAMVDKFTRTKMALECGADLVFELPVYYSCASAEYFAQGAVALLDKLGVVDTLVFGSECGDIEKMEKVASVLANEPPIFQEKLSSALKEGKSYASAREIALISTLKESENEKCSKEYSAIISSPNNILGIEYIKALKKNCSNIKPFTITRTGEGYNSLTINQTASASSIRNQVDTYGFSDDSIKKLEIAMPKKCLSLLLENQERMPSLDLFSKLLNYKLIMEKDNGYTEYLDISEDFSNKIMSNLEKYQDFTTFCHLLKSKDLSFSRISRALLHILLDIKGENMKEYKEDNFTSYARILGMKSDASSLVKMIKENSSIPVISNLKASNSIDEKLYKRLLTENLRASEVYNMLCPSKSVNEYRMKPIIY